MTIVVAAAAPDGIVLAADSRATLTAGRRHRVASDHARKMFVPCDGIGIATFGTAFVGEKTISGLVEEFVAQRRKNASKTVARVATDLAEYVSEILETTTPRPPPGVLGFLVAGYDTKRVGRVWEVLLPASSGRNAVLKHDTSTAAGGVVFRGRTRYVRRMLEGYDETALSRSGVTLPGDAERELRRLGYVLTPTISVQDALDFATFVVRMTIDMERLTDGTYAVPGDVPACGGDMQVLAVTRSGTEWLAQPVLRPRAAGLGTPG